MKKTVAAFAILIVGAASSSATVTIGTNNITGASSGVAVVDNSGAVVAGSVAIGSFLGGVDFENIGSSFTPNGSTPAFGLNGGLGFFNQQFGAGTNTETSQDSSDPFTGSPVYLVIGNSATFGNSTDYIVYNTGSVWPSEDGSSQAALPAYSLIGKVPDYGFLTPRTDDGGFSGITDGVTFGVIPEPSTSLLAGLAGLALVLRRKR